MSDCRGHWRGLCNRGRRQRLVTEIDTHNSHYETGNCGSNAYFLPRTFLNLGHKFPSKTETKSNPLSRCVKV